MEGPLAKFQWAEHHYRLLRDEISPSGNPKAHRVTVQAQGDGLQYSLHVGEIDPLSPHWPPLIGDCLFNLRASLDHLVYQLHVRRFRGRITPEAAEQSAFPIRSRKPKSPTKEWKEIGRLGVRQRRAIQFLQPYITWHDKLRLVRQRLATLHRLNNIDKHRHLHVVRRAQGFALLPRFSPEYGFRAEVLWDDPLESHAEVARWSFTKPPPDVQKEWRIFEAVLLEEDGEEAPVLQVLEGLIENTRFVLDRFAPLLTR